jgi:GNAT superfamily N-acetyltransferase
MAMDPAWGERCTMQIVPLHTGSDRVGIRPLVRADRHALVEEFSHLSEQTRRRRFGTIANQLGERELDRLTDIDHHDHEALAALVPVTGHIIGVARYIALPNLPGAAEVAIEVDDEWQRRGIGSRLMSELVDRARIEGIDRLVAYVTDHNHPVRGWIARSAGATQSNVGDATLYTIPLEALAEQRMAA